MQEGLTAQVQARSLLDRFVPGQPIVGEQAQQGYLDLYAAFRRLDTAEKAAINDDIVFEIELIKQLEITRAINSSPSLSDKKDLIEAFVARVSVAGEVDQEWSAYVKARRDAELAHIIADESLVPDATREFIHRAFRDGVLQTTGVAITRVLPPASRFSAAGSHGEKKQRVLERLSEFFERYFGLG